MTEQDGDCVGAPIDAHPARPFVPSYVPGGRAPVPRKLTLDGAEIVIERLRDHGPYGFRVRQGLHEFAAYDCEWTDEDAESRALKAIRVRLEFADSP